MPSCVETVVVVVVIVVVVIIIGKLEKEISFGNRRSHVAFRSCGGQAKGRRMKSLRSSVFLAGMINLDITLNWNF